MFLKSLAATAAFLLATIAPSFANPVIDRAMDSTVIVYDTVIRTQLDTGYFTHDILPTCSGFVVENAPMNTEMVITAGHCYASQSDPDVETVEYKPQFVAYSDGTRASIVDSFKSKKYDVLLLLVQADRYHPAAKLNTLYQRGDDFFSIGMPDGDFWSYGKMFATQGDYDDLLTGDKDATVARVGAVSLWKGNSGGPVFNTKGEVVGIVTALDMDNPTIFYMTRTQHIIDTVMEMLSSGV